MKNNLKIISAIVILTLSQNISAQQNIGIKTSTPQEKLHVGGPSSIVDNNIGTTGIPLITPTVRINGLNIANNASAFTGTDTTAPLYVDNNGDTSVKKGLETFGTYIIPGDDAITTSKRLDVAGDEVFATVNLLTTSFTINQRSVVYISSNLSADVQNSSGGTLADGKDRMIVGAIYFTSAPASSGIDTTSSYAIDTFVFSNRSTNSANSSFRLNPTCELVLPAGTYTVVLAGRGVAAAYAPDAYRIIFGGGSGDKLNVFARPL
ncbi:hypothetical protein ACQWU4_11380 [Chryseobacterium sp. MIQD13]|uniref:hypothetical protein n=1 Tax=Chryseobacterium sp. MIQD13 TaxID=3422310 RepID=UPI003D268986